MGKPFVDDSRPEPMQADLDALDPARRGWYRSSLHRGASPAEAFRQACAYTPARERMRAVDPTLVQDQAATRERRLREMS